MTPSSEPLQIVPVSSRKELERFVRLPMRLNRGDPAWRPSLVMERMEALTPKTNPFFQHAEVQLWLARRGGRDVGRISAQIDSLAPVDPAAPAGHFGMIAGEDDPEVWAALTGTAEAWLKARGRTRVLGPFNLSINEELGLLVDGFDTPPMLLMGHDPVYAGRRMEACGYAKAKDLLAWIAPTANDQPPAVLRRLERPPPPGVVLRPLNLKRYDDEVRAMTSILNDAWSDNWGFTPTTAAETDQLGKSLRMVLEPDLIWFAEVNGEPAAFIAGIPNLNEAIRDLNGSLLPFGWAKLLWRLKVSGVKTLRIPLMGVRKAHRGTRIGALLPFMLIHACHNNARKRGMTAVEMSWILEDNLPMRHILLSVGAEPYKTYRIYEKALA